MTRLQISALGWLLGGLTVTAAFGAKAAAPIFHYRLAQAQGAATVSPAVDMSWPESAGFLKIIPVTPSMGGTFRAEEWGVLFGPNLNLGQGSVPAAPAPSPTPAAPTGLPTGAPTGGTSGQGAPAVPSQSGPPATLGPAIPGSAPTHAAGPGKVTNLGQSNQQPGDWAKQPSEKDSQIKVKILTSDQSKSTGDTKESTQQGTTGGTTGGAATAGTAGGQGAATTAGSTGGESGATAAGTAGQAATPASGPLTPKIESAPTQSQVSNRIQGAYVSWTPGKIYVAGLVPAGSDLVVSLDSKATGQTFGTADSDYEIRISGTGAPAIFRQAIGGQLQPLTGWSTMVSSLVEQNTGQPGLVLVEGVIQDPTGTAFPSKVGDQFSIRLDAVPSGVQTAAGNPRALSLVETAASKGPNGLADTQGTNEPGLQVVGVTQFTAETANDIQLKPKGTWPNYASQIAIDPIGADSSNLTSGSFNFGAGLANSIYPIPYKVILQKDVPLGYGAFKVTVSNGSGAASNYYLPYRVVGPITIDSDSAVLHSIDADQKVKIKAVLTSNVKLSMKGVFNVGVPQGWSLDKGSDKSFVLYNINNHSNANFLLTVPKGAQPGLYPITLSATFDQKTITHTTYVVIL